MHGSCQAEVCRCLKARKKPAGRRHRLSRSSTSSTGLKGQHGQNTDDGETLGNYRRRFRQKHAVPVLNALKAWLDAIAPKVVPTPSSKMRLLYAQPMGISDALHRRRQDADRQQSTGARHPDLCNGRKSWLFSDTVQGATPARHLQPDVDLRGRQRRTLGVVATRPHRTAAASRRCRYRGPAALQLQKTASLNRALRRHWQVKPRGQALEAKAGRSATIWAMDGCRFDL